MKHTETHYGLINIDEKISADGGKTFLQTYREMPSHVFNRLVIDISNWLEHTLTIEEIEDLKEILDV